MRGAHDEGLPSHDPGVILNGFHETWPILYGEYAFGFATTGQTIVGAPDGSIIRLLRRRRAARPRVRALLALRARARHARRACSTRERRVRAPRAARRRAALAAARLAAPTATSPRSPTRSTLARRRRRARDRLRARARTPPRAGRPTTRAAASASPSSVLEPVERSARRARAWSCELRTRSSGMRARLRHGARVDAARARALESAAEDDERRASSFFPTPSRACRCALSRSPSPTTTPQRPRRATSRARRPHARPRRGRRLRRDRRARPARRVAAFWARSDVAIDGAPDDPAGRALQPLPAAAGVGARSRATASPAKGLTGRGYEGHYFWDTEIYVLPFLIYTSPHVARQPAALPLRDARRGARAGRASSAIAARCSRGARSPARRPRPTTPPAPRSTTSTPRSPTPCASYVVGHRRPRSSCPSRASRSSSRPRASGPTSASSPSAATASSASTA